MAERRRIKVNVNGREYEGLVEPRRHLVDFLREDLGLVGTHVGCEHGICGSCTVLLNGEPVRSCLVFAVQADGAEIMTVEGLGRDGKLHPLQEAFHEHYAAQCGFCTPGMVMSAKALLDKKPKPSREEIVEAVSGNLCRCGCYNEIVEAVEAVAHGRRKE